MFPPTCYWELVSKRPRKLQGNSNCSWPPQSTNKSTNSRYIVQDMVYVYNPISLEQKEKFLKVHWFWPLRQTVLRTLFRIFAYYGPTQRPLLTHIRYASYNLALWWQVSNKNLHQTQIQQSTTNIKALLIKINNLSFFPSVRVCFKCFYR